VSSEYDLTHLVRRAWLTDGPLNSVVPEYVNALRSQRYTERTIHVYLGSLTHFSYWLKSEALELPSLDSSLVERFLRKHLPNC